MDYAKFIQGATRAAVAAAQWEPCDTAPVAVAKALMDKYDSAAWAGWRADYDEAMRVSAGSDMRRLHSAVTKAAKPPAPPPQPPPGTPDTPQAAADAVAAQWGSKWCASDAARRVDSVAAARAALAAARARGAEFAADFVAANPPAVVRARAAAFRKRTATGCDQVTLASVATAPDRALVMLVAIFARCLFTAALPAQALEHFVFALGKAAGGHRIIAVLTSFLRLLLGLLAPGLREWDGRVAHAGDSSAAGAACDAAALRRAALAEASVLRGGAAAQALWDIDAFCSTVSISPSRSMTRSSTGSRNRCSRSRWRAAQQPECSRSTARRPYR